ncbi:MAG: RNase adapter RapZ [Acidobacteria bacterium]|nr:RNase adapter RapZ [Acidobacteriota bacterium]
MGKARNPSPQLVVVTGLSGAGKSQAIHALEDLGFFCIDNLPVALIPTFVDLIVRDDDTRRRVAVVVDVREGARLSQLPAVYRTLKRRADVDTTLVFLEAKPEALVRRFSETRRPHPLGRGRSAAEGVAEESRRLAPIRKLADYVLDTTRLTVHDLRKQMLAFGGGTPATTPLAVTLQSFAFKRGVPSDADVMFDVRFLKNPHFVLTLRPLTGLDRKVARYVLGLPEATKFLTLTTALLRFLLPQYVAEGKAYLTVAIGCTGGRHRSVAIAEALGRALRRTRHVQVRVRHREFANV